MKTDENRAVASTSFVVPCASPDHVTMMMDLPGGGRQGLQLDEAAARDMLAEMETWGNDCSKDCQELRAALRANLGHNVPDQATASGKRR